MTADTPREPVTEAGRRLLDKLHVEFDYEHLGDYSNLIARSEAEARGFAGHRTDDEHDCFLMNCCGLGREVASLREEARAADQAAEARVEGLRMALGQVLLPAAWQVHQPTGALITILSPEHKARLDALLSATPPEPDGPK